jgi:hypothetical protein
LSAMLFQIQGGFGAGHGDFDFLLYVLSFPWSLIEWPEIFYRRDYIWLIVVPLVFNGILVSIPIILLKRQNKQVGENRRPPASSEHSQETRQICRQPNLVVMHPYLCKARIRRNEPCAEGFRGSCFGWR